MADIKNIFIVLLSLLWINNINAMGNDSAHVVKIYNCGYKQQVHLAWEFNKGASNILGLRASYCYINPNTVNSVAIKEYGATKGFWLTPYYKKLFTRPYQKLGMYLGGGLNIGYYHSVFQYENERWDYDKQNGQFLAYNPFPSHKISQGDRGLKPFDKKFFRVGAEINWGFQGHFDNYWNGLRWELGMGYRYIPLPKSFQHIYTTDSTSFDYKYSNYHYQFNESDNTNWYKTAGRGLKFYIGLGYMF